MGIADDMERCRARSLRRDAAVLDQRSADTALPPLRLDEERVQRGVAVLAGQNGREAHDGVGDFGHEDATSFDLPDGELDRIAICEERLGVAWIAE